MPTENVTMPSADGVIDATLHTPEESGSWPGIIMLTDIRGPRQVFFEQADRLAKQGYAVLLPNPYYREGPAPVPDLSAPMEPEIMKALFALMNTLTPERVRIDGKAAVDGLLARPEVKVGPVGVVGYCMGGRFAIYFADAARDHVGAVAAYHGSALISDGPDSPHKVAAGLNATFYFGHADNDDFLPTARVPELEAVLEQAGAAFTSEIYADAPHGFAVSDGPAYTAPAAERHWKTMSTLFEKALG